VNPPTAVHVAAAVHETPNIWVLEAPPGLAVDCTAHDAPFQPSANAVGKPLLGWVIPTASHAALAPHETSLMVAFVTPAGNGMVTSVQAVPFHVSAKGLVEPVEVDEFPTATQSVVDVHETRERRLNVPPVGLGVGWTLHVVPFQTSASVPD
jgi:hypothetical protein